MMLIDIFLYVIIGLTFFTLFRIVRGPTVADRMVAIDIFGILEVGICAILTIKTNRGFIFDIGLAWAIFSFIGTLALAKYLSGRKLDE